MLSAVRAGRAEMLELFCTTQAWCLRQEIFAPLRSARRAAPQPLGGLLALRWTRLLLGRRST